MSVRWPDGSVTGSVRVKKTAPTPDPEPVQEVEEIDDKKEASNGTR